MTRLMILSIIFFSTVILMSCDRSDRGPIFPPSDSEPTFPPSGNGPGVTPKAWGTAELLAGSAGGGPQIAVDGAGHAIAVWQQNDGTRYNLLANTYTAGTGWGTAELIEESDAESAYVPQVAVNGAGNAIAVWLQDDGTRYNLWANTYAAGTGWGTAELIEENDAESAEPPRVAVDGAGNAIAMWGTLVGTRASIWVNTYTAGAGWGAAELFVEGVSGLEATSHYDPNIAVNDAGNAVVVWVKESDSILFRHRQIYANTYTAGTGWGTAEVIDGEIINGIAWVEDPHLAIDGAGNAIAVWEKYDSISTRYNICASTYTAGTGWGTAELLEENDAGGASDPQIAVDGAGKAIAVWHQDDGTRNNIWANTYAAGTGWGTAELLEGNDAGGAYGPQIAVDSAGNAITVWHQDDGARADIWANTYTAGTGWGTAELLEENDAGRAEAPQIAVDGVGNAIAVWHQYDGTREDIWANTYR